MQTLHTRSRLSIIFDDDYAVANAGLAELDDSAILEIREGEKQDSEPPFIQN